MLLASLALLALSATPAPAATAGSVPMRQLVYAFTWGTSSDVETYVGGFPNDGDNMKSTGAASGITDAQGGTQDKGSISVIVERAQPDGGLVVEVSEQAVGRRSSPAATCVVFSNTDVLCDPNKKINIEELTLLRFLGSSFVNPTQIDAGGHWHVARNNPTVSTTADYKIVRSDAGVMTIDETRLVRFTGARPLTDTIDGTIDYNVPRSIPASISEMSIERTQNGESYQTVRSQTVLRLESDSRAATPP